MIMKTVSDIKRLAAQAGATIEEDEGYRDMRVLQIIAPGGKRWLDGHVKMIRVEWATGKSPSAQQHNAAEWLVIAEAVECGLEDIPAEDAELYAVD